MRRPSHGLWAPVFDRGMPMRRRGMLSAWSPNLNANPALGLRKRRQELSGHEINKCAYLRYEMARVYKISQIGSVFGLNLSKAETSFPNQARARTV